MSGKPLRLLLLSGCWKKKKSLVTTHRRISQMPCRLSHSHTLPQQSCTQTRQARGAPLATKHADRDWIWDRRTPPQRARGGSTSFFRTKFRGQPTTPPPKPNRDSPLIESWRCTVSLLYVSRLYRVTHAGYQGRKHLEHVAPGCMYYTYHTLSKNDMFSMQY